MVYQQRYFCPGKYSVTSGAGSQGVGPSAKMNSYSGERRARKGSDGKALY